MTVEVPELMRRALSKETDGRPLPRNEFDLLAEALFQYGDDPSGTPEEGQDRRLPLVCPTRLPARARLRAAAFA
jgi:hypothetical protein